MKCLTDGDIFRYEIGSCGQYIDEDSGETIIREWDFVQKLLDDKISQIYEATMSDGEPVIYLTNSEAFTSYVNKRNRLFDREPLVYKPNFREAVATVKPYKGQRKKEKPHYFHDIGHYLYENYNVRLANGIEADDLLCIDASLDPENSVICSRDKDLRQMNCWHYGWECGKQPEFPMEYVEGVGHIEQNDAKKKVEGTGMRFFYSQMITGDTVDNIPGIPGKGYKAAYKALYEATSVAECKAIVVGMYKDKYGEEARERFTEQARLLFMVRELDEGGEPIDQGWNHTT